MSTSIFSIVGSLAKKDPQSIKNWIDREAVFPDLVEIALDSGPAAAIDLLYQLVAANSRIRNAKRT